MTKRKDEEPEEAPRTWIYARRTPRAPGSDDFDLSDPAVKDEYTEHGSARIASMFGERADSSRDDARMRGAILKALRGKDKV